MPLCRIGATILYFAHIPKTGGSSIESYMASKGPVALRHNSFKDWSRTTPQHMPARIFSDYVPDSFYDHGFAVLRDPKARLMSTFRMRIGTDHAWANPLNWALIAWARLRGRQPYAINVWKFRLSLDFDSWVAIVTRWMRRRPYLYDGHLLPQSDYLHPGQQLFLFEDGLEPVFRWIDQVTGTAPAAGSFHDKKGVRRSIDCSAATERRLRQVYADDYALIARLRAERTGAPETAAPAGEAGIRDAG